MPTSSHPQTPHVVLLEILQLRSSCSLPLCPMRHTTRGVCECVWGLSWAVEGKTHTDGCTRLSKPIQGRSGPSKQQFLHNDPLQWAWKLPQPAAFITHQPQQTGFCFIHFFRSLPFLPVPIREPALSHLVAIQSLNWQVPSNQCGDREAVGFWPLQMWSDVCSVFLPPLGHYRQIFFFSHIEWWLEM